MGSPSDVTQSYTYNALASTCTESFERTIDLVDSTGMLVQAGTAALMDRPATRDDCCGAGKPDGAGGTITAAN